VAWLAGALGGTRTPNLLIRSHPYGRSDPFRSVRALGLVPPGCPAGPEHLKVVQPRGSQRGSQPYASRNPLAVFKTGWAHSEGSHLAWANA
jgi:hypothetical protein